MKKAESLAEKGFHIDIGKYRGIIFSDGYLVDEGTKNSDVSYLNCLYLQSADHKILIDCGCGDAFQSTAGHLVANMKTEGIKPADIDLIIFTHGHIDHVGGGFNSKGQPVFPNARYITSKKEWQYWLSPPGTNELQNAFFNPARKNLLPIPGQFELVNDNAEVLPGIRLIPAHGHTPGNLMVEIFSGGKRLLCIGDIIHSPREFIQPDCLSAFDVVPDEALKTRARVLSEAAESGVLVFACHFEFPGLGYIKKKGTFTWQAYYSGIK